jgi:hypothetical protein
VYVCVRVKKTLSGLGSKRHCPVWGQGSKKHVWFSCEEFESVASFFGKMFGSIFSSTEGRVIRKILNAFAFARVKGQKNVNGQSDVFTMQISPNQVFRGWKFSQSGAFALPLSSN